MRKFWFIFLLLPILCWGADIVSIIVVDTLDVSIGDTVELDLQHMNEWLSDVAENTDLKRREITLKGHDVVAAKMLGKIKEIQVNEDDVILFYFSGHGYRTQSKKESLWPNLYFSLADEGVEYERVVEILQKKHPRLLIVFTDACNNYISEFGAPHVIREKRSSRNRKERIQENYIRLFLQTSGTIFITSSERGQSSYATNKGGKFTNAFLKSISECMSSSRVDWEKILDKAAYHVGEYQTPIYILEILTL